MEMKIFTKNLKVVLLIMMLVMTSFCQATSDKVIITGRTQKLKVEDKLVLDIAQQQYMDYMKTAKNSTNPTNYAMVKRVGLNLANAMTNYMKANGYSSVMADYNWTFNLVQDSKAYAWCMPGGLVVVSEGLLPITQDEKSLAVVLGHEIAHAIARHHLEILSTQVKKWKVNKNDAVSLAKAISDNGFYFYNVSFNQEQESEADRIGMIFASMAGYDPRSAKSFLQRAASANNTQAYLSRHPVLETHMKQIDYCMPEALKYYNPRKVRTTTSQKTIVKKENTGSSTIPESKPVRSSTAATTTTTPTNTVKAPSSQGAVKSNQKRIALIIGNGDYDSMRLPNPINDSKELMKKLKAIGFKTTALTNLNKVGIEDNIEFFAEEAKDYDVALFYYAGHAVQLNGVNYIIPVKERITNEASIRTNCPTLDFVIQNLIDAGVKNSIIILDACRDNPSLQKTTSKRGYGSRGLASIKDLPLGFLIAYSTQPNEEAEDGNDKGDKNSPYAEALLNALNKPMRTIDDIFIEVRNQVKEKTNNTQIPMYLNNLRNSDLYLNTNR